MLKNIAFLCPLFPDRDLLSWTFRSPPDFLPPITAGNRSVAFVF